MGAGIQIRFDLSGGLPGDEELMLVELCEDFFFGFLMEMISEKTAGQKYPDRQGNSGAEGGSGDS